MADGQIEVSISAATAGFQVDLQAAARAAEAAFADITNSATGSAQRQGATENRLNDDRRRNNRERVSDSASAARQEAASWKAAIAEVTSAESKFIDSVFKGRQSL